MQLQKKGLDQFSSRNVPCPHQTICRSLAIPIFHIVYIHFILGRAPISCTPVPRNILCRGKTLGPVCHCLKKCNIVCLDEKKSRKRKGDDGKSDEVKKTKLEEISETSSNKISEPKVEKVKPVIY